MKADNESKSHEDQGPSGGSSSNKSSGGNSAPPATDQTSRKKSVSESAVKQRLSAVQLPAETREFIRSHVVAANFGNIVTVLMQSPSYKDRKLSELRDLVVPALVNNQFRIAEAHKKGSGYAIPVGVILWARVSEDVDKRLSETDNKDIKLTAKDWVSGDILWIMDAVGERRFIAPLLRDLRQKDFKDKKVKYRRTTEKGIEVAVLAT